MTHWIQQLRKPQLGSGMYTDPKDLFLPTTTDLIGTASVRIDVVHDVDPKRWQLPAWGDFKLWVEFHNAPSGMTGTLRHAIYLSSTHGMLEVIASDDSYRIEIGCYDCPEVREYCAWLRTIEAAGVSNGQIFALMRNAQGGLQVSRLANVGIDFEADNYSPEVVAAYGHITAQLTSRTPSGRLVILDGPPGCGKTHLIRSLLKSVEHTKFVLIPPGMTASLGSPEMLPALITAARESLYMDEDSVPQEQPMVLVIEDADDALVPRGSDNMGLISSLLNLSDGIVGQSLDIRIIATTNAHVTDLEPALMRPGRLMAHVHVDVVTHEHAAQILARLRPECVDALAWHLDNIKVPGSKQVGFGSESRRRGYTLAELYAYASSLESAQ